MGDHKEARWLCLLEIMKGSLEELVFEKKLENQASVKQAELGRKDNPGRIMRK